MGSKLRRSTANALRNDNTAADDRRRDVACAIIPPPIGGGRDGLFSLRFTRRRAAGAPMR
jgi:hypothetical protein